MVSSLSNLLRSASKESAVGRFLSLSLALLSSFFFTLFIYLLSRVIAHSFYHQFSSSPQVYVWIFSSFVLFLLCSHISDTVADRVATKSVRFVKNSYLNTLFHLRYDYAKDVSTSDVFSVLEEFNQKAFNYFRHLFRVNALVFLVPLYLLVLIFHFHFYSFLVLLFALIFIPIIMALVGMYTAQKANEQLHALSILSLRFLDAIRGLEVLKIFNQSHLFEEKLVRSNEEFREKTLSILKVAFVNTLAMDFFSTISTALVAVLVGYHMIVGRLSFEDGLFVLMIVPSFFQIFKQFSSHYHTSKEAVNAMEKMIFPSTMLLPSSSPYPKGIHTLQLENITLRQGNHSLVEGFNCRITHPSIVCLMGESGFGKTTLLNSLVGLQPLDGVLKIDDNPISSLQSLVSFLPQKPHFFNATLMDNISMGENVKEVDVLSMLSALNLEKTLLAKENALHFELSKNQDQLGLSGGELKRLGISRALLKDVPFYVLDEPCENLDEGNIALLMNLFQKLKQSGKTIIFSSHHPKVKPYCDTIIEFERGGIHVNTTS